MRSQLFATAGATSRSSPPPAQEALWYTVYAALLWAHRPGDRLPSLRELCEHYRVSRVTAERSIDVLRHEGLVSGVPGVGTFAAQPARRRARARTTP